MIDICAFFEYTTDVSRGKMVTNHRKNLLASCLFLLGYSSFFLLAVSGSYDYTASEALASELEPSKAGKDRSEWLSNHEWDYSSLKGNYHSRKKSRSTLEKGTSRTEGAWTEEETNRGVGGKWVPRRRRKFERFVGPESIENASESVQEEKEKENTDAMKITEIGLLENDNNLENDTSKEISERAKTEKEDHVKDKVSGEEGKERNRTEIFEFRSMVPRFPTKTGQVVRDGEPIAERYLTQRWDSSLGKVFPKEIFERRNYRHVKDGEEEDPLDIDFENSEDSDVDEKEEEEDADENGEEEGEGEDVEEEKEETELDESTKNNKTATNESFEVMELQKIISDLFLPMENNDSGIGHYPWKALTSSRYTKEITDQEGPYIKRTTKESKSKMNLFFANDLEQTIDIKNNATNSSKVDDSEIFLTQRTREEPPNEKSESTETIRTNEAIEETTTESTNLPKNEECETMKKYLENLQKVPKENDASHDTIYQILDNTVLYVTGIINSPDGVILDWY